MDATSDSVARAAELTEPRAMAAIEDPDLRRVLRSYISDGRLPTMPRAGNKRKLLLAYLATAFEPGLRYSEVEVNAIARVWFSDAAALRRYLVDEGLLSRADGQYWRSGGYL